MSIVEGCSVSKVAINLSQLAQTFHTLFAAVDTDSTRKDHLHLPLTTHTTNVHSCVSFFGKRQRPTWLQISQRRQENIRVWTAVLLGIEFWVCGEWESWELSVAITCKRRTPFFSSCGLHMPSVMSTLYSLASHSLYCKLICIRKDRKGLMNLDLA